MAASLVTVLPCVLLFFHTVSAQPRPSLRCPRMYQKRYRAST